MSWAGAGLRAGPEVGWGGAEAQQGRVGRGRGRGMSWAGAGLRARPERGGGRAEGPGAGPERSGSRAEGP